MDPYAQDICRRTEHRLLLGSRTGRFESDLPHDKCCIYATRCDERLALGSADTASGGFSQPIYALSSGLAVELTTG